MTLVPFPRGMHELYRPPQPRTDPIWLSVVLGSLALALGLWLAFVTAITFGLMSFLPR